MPHKTAATVAHTIGIDTGKNTLHLIGLDDQGAIVLREKIARSRIAARLANVPRRLVVGAVLMSVSNTSPKR
jgi:transposase